MTHIFSMNEATRQFSLVHADDDVRQLALQGSKDASVDMTVALRQISGRQAARRKVSSWAALDDIQYPVHLSMEQCSSEATARYKARLVRGLLHAGTYRKLVDLTGGFGVDFAFLCEMFDEGVYVERDEALCATAHHNFQVLGLAAASVVCAEAETFLNRMEEHVTLIFIDPARRNQHGARTYGLSDCSPDVLPMMDALLSKAGHVLLKLSPMLDWRKAVADVGAEHVEQVHIVAVGGECKELLLLLSAKGSEQPLLVCSNDDRQETFLLNEPPEALEPCQAVQPPFFLCEPHAALMKGGCFGQLASRYGVAPLASNSHLFAADAPVDHFPGRMFQVIAVSTMNRQELKQKVLPIRQANISVRNFPMTADALRKKLKLGDGGEHYLFATTLADGTHVLLVCQKV